MIGTLLLIGAAGLLLASFWEDIVNWLKKAVEKIKSIVSGVVYGCKVFIQKIKEGAKEISKHYSKEGTQWTETIVQKTIPLSDVPEEIRNKVNRTSGEVDITQELENQLA